MTKAKHICKASNQNEVNVSKETHHYLELYTNNYFFTDRVVDLKSIGRDVILSVSLLRGQRKIRQKPHLNKNLGL